MASGSREVKVLATDRTDYGRCPCGGIIERRRVDVRMTVDDELQELRGVPQGACPHCGSRMYKAAELEALECVHQGRRLPEPRTFW